MSDVTGLRSGFELVRGGLCDGTRREIGHPRRWRGLSAGEVTILSAWLGLIRDDVLELHTDVPVGVVPVLDDLAGQEFYRNQIASLHPLRIDACVRRSDGWRVCEVKSDAGYHALGQVLCYLFWASRCCRPLSEATGVVVTDRVQEALRPVFVEHRIAVEEVGTVLTR